MRLFKMFPAMTYSPILVSRTVPSALKVLTSEFEMGSGVSLSLLSPENIVEIGARSFTRNKD